MLIIFYDSNGIIHKKFIPQDKTVNKNYYLSVIKCLIAKIGQIRPQYQTQGS